MTRRAISLLLIFTLLLAPAALASQALGWELYQTDTVLGPGLSVSAQTLWGDSKQDYRREQYAVYTPGQGTQPVVCYGTSVPATATLTSMAKGLEEYGYRVLAGANGDYFVMASGVPLGMVVSYGALRTSSSYHYAVGFDADGKCFVGKPDLTISAAFHGYDLTVSGGFNKTRTAKDGYFLYSTDFGPSTRASGGGVNVVLRPVDLPQDYVEPQKPGPAPVEPQPPEGLDPEALWAALAGEPGEEGEAVVVTDEDLAALNAWEETRAQYEQDKAAWDQAMAEWKAALLESAAGLQSVEATLTIGGRVECVVESVVDQSGAVDIPQGRFVLSISKSGDEFLRSEVQNLVPGERLSVLVSSPDPRWNSAYAAIGAYEYILQNGQVPGGLDQNADPRTALGIKADGTVLLYTIDGRRSGHSVGASVNQVAKRLQELGCVEAVLFDGGGSTTFGTTGALDQSFALSNKPSQGSQRAVSDALFFVSEEKPTGVLGSVHLQPQSALMLSGARQSLTGLGIDTGFYPLGGEPLSGLTYRVDGPGSMEGDVFVAGAQKGVATVTATAANGAAGTARMTVVDTPDTIDVTDAAGAKVTALNLDPGQQAALNAAASWYKLPLLADDTCFTWTLSEELGSVDEYGNLTAGPKAGSGALTVTAGAKSVSIPITIGGHVNTLEPWEEGAHVPVLDPEGAIRAELTAQQVRYGKSALKVEYLTGGTNALPLDLPVVAGESQVGFWAYDMGQPPTLALRVELADGSETSVPCTAITPEQWSFVQADLPENTTRLTGLEITWHRTDTYPPGVIVPGGVFWDTLYLDHFTTANGPIVDTTPPTVKLSVQNGQVTAKLSDNVDKTFDPARIQLTLDGWGMEFTLTGDTLTAAVPVDSLLHRLSLTVTDASGNLARTSVELAPTGDRALPFTDIDGHWAKNHIVFLRDQGVTNGRQAEDGNYVFDPDTNITRAEFATMLARWLRSDLTASAGADLPFADAADIPSWALEAVAYLYQTGVMTGSMEGDGLYAAPNDPITRCQAMTMLGRIQPKGYAAQTEVFADDGDIPSWARDHVYTLAGQGVVSGYDGFVRPLDPVTRGEVAKLLTTMW